MKTCCIICLIMFIFFTSCDELLNPSSDYVIEKSVVATSEEQVLEAGNDFKIIFPPNAVNQNIELKVKKESSAPTFSISNMKLGSNLYKISFKGFQSFAKTVNIYLKYDPSKIESGKTPEQSVKGMIYSNGTWKEANFEIDKVNSKIIFNINNLSSSSLKDESVLMADDEIIIGDGYTTTDEGQSDNPLARFKSIDFRIELLFTNQDNKTTDLISGYKGSDVKWNGNKFSVDSYTENSKTNSTYKTVITGETTVDGKHLVYINFDSFVTNNNDYSSEHSGPDVYYEYTRKARLENIPISLVDNISALAYLSSGTDSLKEHFTNFNYLEKIKTWSASLSDWKYSENLLKSYSFDNDSYIYLKFSIE